MPEANQYIFNNRELLALLIKQAGVHEGRWTLLVNFAFSAGNFGPTNDQMSPGAIVVVNHIGIQKAQADTPVEMSLDAAVVNPPSASNEKQRLSGRSRRAAP